MRLALIVLLVLCLSGSAAALPPSQIRWEFNTIQPMKLCAVNARGLTIRCSWWM